MSNDCINSDIEQPIEAEEITDPRLNGPPVYIRNEDGSIPIYEEKIEEKKDGSRERVLEKSKWTGDFSYEILDLCGFEVWGYKDNIPILEEKPNNPFL